VLEAVFTSVLVIVSITVGLFAAVIVYQLYKGRL